MASKLNLAGRALLLAIFLLLAINISCTSSAPRESHESITVSAASDLVPAFEEMGRVFEQETGHKITFNFGSTGQLAQQVEQGAPVDLFAAANVSFIDDLEKKGLIISETKALYAQGRITIWAKADSTLNITKIEDLNRPEIKRIAIANPEHAPYGMAARDAMKSAGIWDKVSSKLVFGENIRQTLQYAETGNVDVAIVALSLSIGSNGQWTLVPKELHEPLNQALAVIKNTKHEAVARRFAEFINGSSGRPIMRKYGFVLPGEEPL